MKDSLLENLPPITRYEISQQLYAGYKINAIKLYREATGCDLLTAKQAVEKIEADLRVKNPYAFTDKTTNQSSGLKVVVLVLSVGLVLTGLAVFIAASLQETPTSSPSQLKKTFDEIISSIDMPKSDPKNSEPESSTATQPQEKSKLTVPAEPPKPVDDEEKPRMIVDISPYLPLPEPNTSLDKLFEEKLANPAYLAWMNLPGLPRGYQNYPEEHRIKAKRAALAKKLIAPAQEQIFTIPKPANLAIYLDGRIDKDEWQNALVIPFIPAETGSVLYLQIDNDWLYLAADVPKDSTATGFDQFRFYIHIDINPAIRNERIHASGESEQILGGIRETTIKWQGTISENENERWKKYPLHDWQIYRLARASAGLNPHRQYEAKLYLKEIGLSEAAPFPAFSEIETDPVYENGRFKNRVYLGGLGNQEKPLWFRMQ